MVKASAQQHCREHPHTRPSDAVCGPQLPVCSEDYVGWFLATWGGCWLRGVVFGYCGVAVGSAAFYCRHLAIPLSSDRDPLGEQISFEFCSSHVQTEASFRAFTPGSGKTSIFSFRFPNRPEIIPEAPGQIPHLASAVTLALPQCGEITLTSSLACCSLSSVSEL